MRINSSRLSWKDNKLYRQGSRAALLSVVPDARYPGMWRVQFLNGRLSGMVNKTRAKDAGISIALQLLEASERRAGDAVACSNKQGLGGMAFAPEPRPAVAAQ
jgi:hypothetical protein